MIKNAKESFFIIEKIQKYRKCPALSLTQLNAADLGIKVDVVNDRGSRLVSFDADLYYKKLFSRKKKKKLNLDKIGQGTDWNRIDIVYLPYTTKYSLHTGIIIHCFSNKVQ